MSLLSQWLHRITLKGALSDIFGVNAVPELQQFMADVQAEVDLAKKGGSLTAADLANLIALGEKIIAEGEVLASELKAKI